MLTGLSLSTVALLLVAGVVLDLLLGETRRWHPLVGFGNLASFIERRLNRDNLRLPRGSLAWALAVLPLSILFVVLTDVAGLWLHAVLLYLCIGLRSLRDHTIPIYAALRSGDLAQARALTARIVSRDTANASESDLAKASAESLLENGNDAVFGTLFWFILLGGPGAVLFRLANTLDAMWGYRSTRFNLFGRPAARIDDVMNYVPARLTALSYVLLAGAGRASAWHCWRTQAPAWSSPNAGPVMASGAGALGVSLGGAAVYDGEVEQRPPLGAGPAACAGDIQRAWRLVLRTTLLWLGVVCLLAVLTMIGAPHA
ncbi:adenosylcobinamide-phosphate synthase [Massilia aurea]|uniref:Cobalamin biosynthesis protein CobD n=1 Tax=Massilia aurea TaxID=373040 RepID=A0A7X0CGQ7_9BURK|nr:adenosylcobinamide-phosphate synthase [Massilia aurea]